ncbi:MAG: hypothetical protein JWR89_4694 [Tardiphaga sp.]|jgi:uncharacterized SAM-binding protein YcdF (DUF218 family)|nr:hypothetical protein [Tardiphaga sp.]
MGLSSTPSVPMFFALSKILGFFTLPSNAIAAVCAIGALLLLLQRQRAGTLTLTFGILLLLIFGYSPAGNVLMLSLTERFPAWQSDGRDPDGIIILGGAIDQDATVARGTVEMNGAAERMTSTIELARRFPKARVVFSGGSSNLMQKSVPEAPVAGDWLQRFGVAAERITLESDSRTTDENAAFTRRILMPKPGERWLLVTSAFHMPRSIGAFRAAGFNVEAYPVDWRSRGWIDANSPFDSLSAGLVRTDLAMHEWTGLVGYWLTGRSSALFPAPQKP